MVWGRVKENSADKPGVIGRKGGYERKRREKG